jgi:hypothetical protein
MVGGAAIAFAPQIRFPGKIVVGLLPIVTAVALQQ